MEKYLTGNGILTAAVVVLALAWAFNIISSAVTNLRRAQERNEEPIRNLQNQINVLLEQVRDMESRFGDMCREVNGRVDAVERGVDTHSTELEDLHTGQTELCRGVQALLEHALHNGNETEMAAASQSIGKWLRTR